MALKEKALKRMAEKLNAAGVVWAAGGDWLLAQKGWLRDYHDFEVTAADDEAADRVLTRLGMRQEGDPASGQAAHYHFDGADVTLMSAQSLPGGLPESVAQERLTVLGVQVPVLTTEALLAQARQTGNHRRAELISACLGETSGKAD
ncbi:MAG: hypothetical protein IKP40_14155 [Clostridia bacterium]|nr:hypothetical protein [Clostridia bacterium]